MKRFLFFCIFLIVLLVKGNAQDSKPNTERWRKVFPEQKVPKIDTTFWINGDSAQNPFPSVPVDIPNLYSKNQSYNSRMPVIVLSGKGLSPMPGTEKLDNMKDIGIGPKEHRTMPILKKDNKAVLIQPNH